MLFHKKVVPLRSILLDVAQLVAHLVRDQEVAGSSPVIQTKNRDAKCVSIFVLFQGDEDYAVGAADTVDGGGRVL